MPARPDPSSLRWTVHPAAREPARSLGVLALLGVATALTFSITRSVPMSVLALLVLGVSLRAFFLPRHYVLDEQGAREEGPLQAPRGLAWDKVRAVTRERHGVHISPLHRPSRWLPDRGLFLRTTGNVEDVAAFVLARRPPP
ncbi:MAG: hypothetical protein ACYTG2_08655 [Planctomycetota bacterium]|jgi:hypothetical protein